ncbi:MAG: amidohydrolase family protein [Lentisphaerae bacterium]|nr:amidohydrolase family protein [Lentisphaerota bacterium]
MRAKPTAPDLDSLRLFDSCLTLGDFVLSRAPAPVTAQNVTAFLDRYHIAEALVHDHHARYTHPREHGNRRLLEAIRGNRRLHPSWVLEPPKKPERKAAEAVVREMLNAGVKVARLPMKAVPPMAWWWKDLLSVLEAHRVPCFLDFGGVTSTGALSNGDVDGIRDIALAHPRLPLVLSNVFGGLGVHAAVVPLIRRVPNLYLDNAGILQFWREVAVEVGPERVLFATAAPFVDAGILISNVQYTHTLDMKAKRMICGDNLRRLIRSVR